MKTRREFLKLSVNTGIFLYCGFSMESCSSTRYIYLSGDSSKLTVNKADFGENNFVVLKHPRLSAPVYLTKKPGSEYNALLMLCTHKGCEIRPQGNYLVCPCHGSEFSDSGKVLKSPATENLRKFQTSDDDNFVYVEIK